MVIDILIEKHHFDTVPTDINILVKKVLVIISISISISYYQCY